MEYEPAPPSMPDAGEEFGSRVALRHVLAPDGIYPTTQLKLDAPIDSAPSNLQARNAAAVQQNESRLKRKSRGGSEGTPQPTAMTMSAMKTTTRRNANGTVSSVYNGNRVRYLKKEDGEPLWRGDIQFAFLNTVFSNDAKVFTNASDGTTGHSFADIYIDAMAKSSKTSLILKEKLVTDRGGAIDMAMICLLVNTGRMNTTVNFFPEMRARIRTYHSVPVIQAQQGPQAYKQLQDGPRLKSILKGATEDTPQPSTIEEIMNHTKGRTNPVNLVFVFSQYASRITELHFQSPRDWFDLFLRKTLSSKSRANAFLWLMWWYLESDFSEEDYYRNPFTTGTGQPVFENGVPKVPGLEAISEEQAAAENVDTEEEVAYAEAKKKEREAVNANEMPPTASKPARGNKTPLMEHQHNYRFRHSPFGTSGSESSEGRSRNSQSPMRVVGEGQFRMPEDEHDADRTRSPSPAHIEQPPKIHGHASWIGNPDVRVNTLLHEGPSPAPVALHNPSPSSATSRRHPANVGVGRGNWPRKPKENTSQAPEILPQQPQPNTFYQAAPIHPAHIAHAPPMYYFNPDPNIPHVQHMASPRGPIPVQYVQIMHGPQQIGPPGYYHPSGHYMPSQLFHDPASLNGSVRISDAMGAGTSGSSKRSSRPQTTYQQAVEQSRRMQVDRLLWTNMHAIQSRKRKERKRRGVVVDAWVKCVRLPDGWDSADDEGARLGGVDDITRINPRAAAGVGSGTNGGTAGQGDAASAHEEEWGDVGARAGVVARSFRRVGKKLDGIIIGGHGQRRRWARADGAGYPDNEAEFDALSPLRGPRSIMDNADRQLLPGYTVTAGGPIVASEYKKREDPTSTPAAKKKLIKRKPPQKRSTAAAPAARQGGQAHLNGQQGIPVREFLAHRPMGVWRLAGCDDDGQCWLEMEDEEGVHRRIGMRYDRRVFDKDTTESGLGALATDRLARAAEEEEEIDEVDRELLADVDADESGSGSGSVQGVHDSVALGNGGRSRSENASSNGDENGNGGKSPGSGEGANKAVEGTMEE